MNNQKREKELQEWWVKQEALFTGHDLLVNGYQVMQDWEDEYMKRLAGIATSTGGHVLEFGFGLGISAGFIQRSDIITKHTIIEAHPEVVKFAYTKFPEALASGRMNIIQDFWESATPKIANNSLNGILFDTSPLNQETVFFHYFPVFPEAHRLLRNGGVFTYFSDEPERISDEHLKKLREAGFNNIDFEIVNVRPSPECRYWPYETIVAPIVRK